MKHKITFKSPDAVENAIQNIESPEEQETLRELSRKWVKYGEYITVEIDTLSKTIQVCPITVKSDKPMEEQIYDLLFDQRFVDWYEGKFNDHVGDFTTHPKEEILADIKRLLKL